MVVYLHLLDLLLPSTQKHTVVLAQIWSVGEWMSFHSFLTTQYNWRVILDLQQQLTRLSSSPALCWRGWSWPWRWPGLHWRHSCPVVWCLPLGTQAVAPWAPRHCWALPINRTTVSVTPDTSYKNKGKMACSHARINQDWMRTVLVCRHAGMTNCWHTTVCNSASESARSCSEPVCHDRTLWINNSQSTAHRGLSTNTTEVKLSREWPNVCKNTIITLKSLPIAFVLVLS